MCQAAGRRRAGDGKRQLASARREPPWHAERQRERPPANLCHTEGSRATLRRLERRGASTGERRAQRKNAARRFSSDEGGRNALLGEDSRALGKPRRRAVSDERARMAEAYKIGAATLVATENCTEAKCFSIKRTVP